jgi:hypothetical protein
MSVDAPAVSLTRSFAELLSTWPADDPALLDQCRLLLLGERARLGRFAFRLDI